MNARPREFHSVKELAERLGLSLSMAYKEVNAGRVASIRIGSKLLIPSAEIDKLIADAMRTADAKRGCT